MKKKGFTLIELLAVIVILAIIALIAVPIVLQIIGSSKKSASLRSMELYISGLENSIASQQALDQTFNPKKCIIRSGKTTCDNIELEVAKLPKDTEGTFIINKGQVESGTMYTNSIQVEYKNDKTSIVNNDRLEEPDLSIGLTPVKYNGTNWVVADTKSEWYNYEKQEWANAVLLKDGVSKNIGDTVNIEGNTADIIGIFVWIPRFEYKIEGTYGKGGTSASLPGEIEINFLSQYTTSSKSGYRLHPGFTFGNTQLSGLWIGKFETTGDSSNPTVLANTSSLRSQNVSSQFTTSQLLTSKLTNGDSHMTKGSEWMTAAYLSQSKYGKYGNTMYTGANKEVYQNKSSSYITGSSNGTPSQDTTNTQCKYNDITDRGSGTGLCGGGASTTGNIYGIYDMSGGSWEYQMSNYNKISGYTAISYTAEQAKTILGRNNNAAVGIWNSGFNGPVYGKGLNGESLSITDGKLFPDSKYYKLYTTTNKTTACNGPCYGITEIRGWYGDSDGFVSSDSPWLLLGGFRSNDTYAGVFNVNFHFGNANDNVSFRLALTSQ